LFGKRKVTAYLLHNGPISLLLKQTLIKVEKTRKLKNTIERKKIIVLVIRPEAK